jgi:serine/threonine-protein kinase
VESWVFGRVSETPVAAGKVKPDTWKAHLECRAHLNNFQAGSWQIGENADARFGKIGTDRIALGGRVSEGSPVLPGGFGPGSRVAGYLLEEQIGQGGMAVVFRAHDERLDRTVALKILAPALAADDAFRLRFIRESRAAAAVDDPHIIPVFEAGEASGVLFIAMRYVRGGDVKGLLAMGQLMPIGRAVEIVSQAASALDAAHGRGLVHRDVKPANMLLDVSSGAGRPDHVYLSDFGLSKGSLQTSGLTGTGTFLGTLDYISPEQIEGKPVDGRADEYALACAAFELLSGSPPFQRDEAMAVMYAQLSEPPPPVTRRRRDLPLAVNDVFFKALAKAPADRYASCREFAAALRDALGIRPYDSGERPMPGAEFEATRIVGSSQPGTAPRPPDQPSYPGPGYAGQEAPTGVAGGQGAGGQGAGPGGGPFGPPVGAGAIGGGEIREAETRRADGGRQTAPDQTAAHWQQPLPGYADYGGQASLARPWWKSPLALVAAVIVLIAGGAAAYALTRNSGGGGGPGGGGQKGGGHHHHVALPPLKPPKCKQATASAAKVHNASQFTPTVAGTGSPFGVQVSKDGRALFVVTDRFLDVYKLASDGTLTAGQWSYPIPSSPGVATNAVLTPDGSHLLVASSNGIDVFSTAAAEAQNSSAYVGTLTVPGIAPRYGRAIDVAVTPDGKWAFVSLGFADEVGVFDLGTALRTNNFTSSSLFVGSLSIGANPTGLTMSSDGSTLYATAWITASPPVPGVLAVIDVAKATNPTQMKSAVVSKVTTGCQPARIAISRDNKTVWVTTEQSNYVLGYSASMLRNKPGKSLIAKVKVGKNPIAIALLSGQRMLVADSGDTAGPPNDLAVINSALALARKPGALLGLIRAHVDPHEIAVNPAGTIAYVTNRLSDEIQVVNLSKIP